MPDSEIFFIGFQSLTRTLIIGVLAYTAIIFLLRISGRRTLSKMNAFDFIVTIALGSTLATVLLNKSVSLADGVLAFSLLIGLQYIVTWTSVRYQWIQKIVTGEPTMLLCRGEFLPRAMRKSRVTEHEILAALRSNGVARAEDADAVILETDGSFSVICTGTSSGCSTLIDVKGPNPQT